MELVNVLGETCRVEWRNDRLVAELSPRSFLIEILGEVREKNDGRWEWFLKTTNWFQKPSQNQKPQGVTNTRLEAAKRLEEIWGFECASSH